MLRMKTKGLRLGCVAACWHLCDKGAEAAPPIQQNPACILGQFLQWGCLSSRHMHCLMSRRYKGLPLHLQASAAPHLFRLHQHTAYLQCQDQRPASPID